MDALINSTTAWVALAFVIFWALALKPLVKAVQSWLDGKIVRVQADIDSAAALRREAEALLADAQSRLNEAATEAADMLTRAKAEAKQIQEQSQKDITTALATREAQAMSRIAQAEKQAMQDIQQLAATAAVEATRTLLATDLSDSAKSQLADKAIADISGKAA